MTAVHIRNVPEETVARLKARAASNGRSYEAELRIVLDEAAAAPMARKRRQISWHTATTHVTTTDRHELYYPDDEERLGRE